jgi:hypothetical protein
MTFTARFSQRETLAELYYRNRFLVWAAVGCALYCLAFIARTSFRIGGERYFSLFDDAMISMQYGRNLSHGYGLVWNPGGERVEGYTNPLWVLYMAGVHLLPLAPSKFALVVQLTAAALLLVNLVLVAKLTEQLSGDSTLASATAVLLTASYWPLNNWALQGMEVSLLCVMVTASALLALRMLRTERVSYLLYLVLGLGTLVRPDMVVPLLAMLMYLVIVDRAKRRHHAALGIATLAVFVGGQTAFRWLYYGDVLPNTYYLKMTGYPTLFRVVRGALVFGDFVGRLGLGLILLAPGLVFLRRDRGIALLLTLIGMQAAYNIYVGGDAWEFAGGSNRYLSIVMPLLFVLVGCGVEEWYRFGGRYLNTKVRRGDWTPRLRLVSQLLLVLTAVTLNLAAGPEVGKRWALLMEPLYRGENANRVHTALLLREVTDQKATIAVVWAGAEPYFMARSGIDMLGKNDRRIAHEPMHPPRAELPRDTIPRWFYPGHLKWDYAYSIGQLQPDVVTELWENPEEAEPYLNRSYSKAELHGDWTIPPLYLRKNSPHILWQRVEQLSKGPP